MFSSFSFSKAITNKLKNIINKTYKKYYIVSTFHLMQKVIKNHVIFLFIKIKFLIKILLHTVANHFFIFCF